MEKLSARIRYSYAKYTGSSHGDDDCVQDVLCELVSGRREHSTIDQITIDCLRSRNGRKGLPGYDGRKSLEHAIAHGSEEPSAFDVRSTRVEPDIRMDCERMLRRIGNKIDRASFGLYHKWGLSEVEIGDLFGFSESRVSQRLQRVQGSLSARASQEASRKRSGERAMEKVLREEKEFHMERGASEGVEREKSFSAETLEQASF